MAQPIILDVSSAQYPPSIDWAKAKAGDDRVRVVGAIVRVEAFSKVDSNFHAHAENVLAHDLPLGAYGFQATDDDPKDEIKATLEALKPYAGKLGLGLWNDVETLNKHSPSQTIAWDRAYAQGCADGLGQPTGLYTGLGFWRNLGIEAQADDYAIRRLWVAAYTTGSLGKLEPWSAWGDNYGPCLWQRWGNTIWSNKLTREQKWGKACPGDQWVKIASALPVPGCVGEVDVSIMPGDDIERVKLY